jgi:hypothetical protein
MGTDVHYVRAKGVTVVRVYKGIPQNKQKRRRKR